MRKEALEFLEGLPFWTMLVGTNHRLLYANESVMDAFPQLSSTENPQIIRDFLVENELTAPCSDCFKNHGKFVLPDILVKSRNEGIRMSINVFPMAYEEETACCMIFQPHHNNSAGEENLLGRKMVAVLAHEISNPITGIYGSLQLMRKKFPGQKELLPYLDVINKEIFRVKELLDQLKQLKESPEKAPDQFILYETLNECVSFFTQTSQIVFERMFDPSLPNIEADRNGLYRVFLNLIKNAIEASLDSKNTVVTLKTYFLPPWELDHSLRGTKRQYCAIKIIDHGEGVAKDDESLIFQPFFTTKSEGKGLGLSICAELMRKMGGHLKFESFRDPTIIKIIVPLADE